MTDAVIKVRLCNRCSRRAATSVHTCRSIKSEIVSKTNYNPTTLRIVSASANNRSKVAPTVSGAAHNPIICRTASEHGYDRTDVDRAVSARADSLGLQPPPRAWLVARGQMYRIAIGCRLQSCVYMDCNLRFSQSFAGLVVASAQCWCVRVLAQPSETAHAALPCGQG